MLSHKAHLELMARYNQVMNARLIAVLEPVSHDQLIENRGAFFGSILGTLNHLMVADLMWLNRIRPQPYGAQLNELDRFPRPVALTETLHPSLDSFRPARTDLDQIFIAFITSLTDEAIASPLTYRNYRGDAFSKTLGLVLSHVFNHQTHHRGQITTLLSQMGLDIGVTDLAPMVPDL